MNGLNLIPCAKCGKVQHVKREWIGRKARCKGCGFEFVIPQPSQVTVDADKPSLDTGPLTPFNLPFGIDPPSLKDSVIAFDGIEIQKTTFRKSTGIGHRKRHVIGGVVVLLLLLFSGLWTAERFWVDREPQTSNKKPAVRVPPADLPLDGNVQIATAPDAHVVYSLGLIEDVLATLMDGVNTAKSDVDSGKRSSLGSEWIGPAIADGDRLLAKIQQLQIKETFPTKTDRDEVQRITTDTLGHIKTVTDTWTQWILEGVRNQTSEDIEKDKMRQESKMITERISSANGILDTMPDGPYTREIKDMIRPIQEEVDQRVRRMNSLTNGPLESADREQVRQLWKEIEVRVEVLGKGVEAMNSIQREKNTELKRLLR